MGTIHTFEDLEAWKSCRAFRVFISRRVTKRLVETREFSLAEQIKRSSRSTTNNIAEGFGRFHFRDNDKFCSIARGSLNEALDQVICAVDEDLVCDEVLTELRPIFDHASKVLNGDMAHLTKSAAKSQ